MEIAAVLNVHSNPDCVLDTIDSIKTFVTDKILVVVDGAKCDEFQQVAMPVHRVAGFSHNQPKSPYRNVALALKTGAEIWPDVQWYVYCEYDVLFASFRYRENLKIAEEKNVWMLGNDGHVDDVAMPLVQGIIDDELSNSYYLLGCCQFFHRNFIKKLVEIDFFDRFLNMTSGFAPGHFPFYSGYDLSEHMYPSLCRHFGGNIGVFASYDEQGEWHGAFRYFPCRWRPELNPDTENFAEASILHPLKNVNHPIRAHHREKRKIWKSLKKTENPSAS